MQGKEGNRLTASELCRIARERLGDLYEIWREAPRDHGRRNGSAS